MKGLERGIRLAAVASAIALLAVTLAGFAAAGSDEDEQEGKQKTVGRQADLKRSLNGRSVASTETSVEGTTKDGGSAKSSMHSGSPDRAPAERRGRLDRLGSTTIGLEQGDADDDRETGLEVMVLICHKPETRAEKTLLIPEEAVPGHLGHGDFTGTCDGNETESAP